MDMKRILQALDGASTKSVEGVNDMARFLRAVTEADINQPAAAPAAAPQPAAQPAAQQVPPMPDITGLQPGEGKDLEAGERVKLNTDGTVSYAGAWGTYIYNAQGQHIKTQSPSFAGYQQTTDAQGQVTDKSYNAGPLSIQQGQQGSSASYDLGTTTVSQSKNAQGQVTQQAMTPNAQPQTVQENSMAKFLSVIDKNSVSILTEGANPHKVSLPVQMAMQHYQNPVQKKSRPALIDKYFSQVEEEQLQERKDRKSLINQYASTIAQRVLMKESTLKNKEDLQAKRKALQDIQMDPHTHKDPELKAELAWRKAQLEKEAKQKGLDENFNPKLGPNSGFKPGPGGPGMMSNESHNAEDVVTMDIPLFIRLLEWAREDAQTDIDLHNVAENVINLSAEGDTLTMMNYESIIPSDDVEKELGENKTIKPKRKSDPCWTGYHQVGMKKKDNKMVPNCTKKNPGK